MWEKIVEDICLILNWNGVFCHDPFSTVNLTVEEVKEILLHHKEHFEERWDINENVSG